MTFEEYCPVYLPSYKALDLSKKEKLIEICKADNVIKMYLPDKNDISCISRDFLLSVRYYFYFLANLLFK